MKRGSGGRPIAEGIVRRWDGRVLLAILLAGIFAFTLWAARSPENHKAWNYLGVFQLSPAYLDWWVMPAMVKSYQQGYDPFRFNPYDPFGRAPPYPRLWVQIPVLLGMTPNAVLSLAPWVVASFLLSLLLLAPPVKPAGVWPYAVAVLSPSVLLGVERCNCDLAVFVLVAVALYLVRRGPWGVAGAAFATLVAGMLKYYPISALAFLAGKKKREALLAGGAAAILFLFYIVATWKDMLWNSRSLDPPGDLSYGIQVLPVMVQRFAGVLTGTRSAPAMPWVLPIAGLLAVAAFLLVFRRGWAAGFSGDGLSAGAADGFRAGAAIFLFTFIAGNSYDYKLIYLLPVLPALLAAARPPAGGRGKAAHVALIAIAVALWGDAPIVWCSGNHSLFARVVTQAAVLLKLAATWTLAVLFAAALLSGLPDWAGGHWVRSLSRGYGAEGEKEEGGREAALDDGQGEGPRRSSSPPGCSRSL